VLGEGCSGKVVVAKSRATGRKCALKRIKKNSVSPRILQQLIAEVEICLTLDHPNVVRLDDVYETDHEIALLTECLEGGELYGRLADAKVFSEPAAAETTQQLLRAVGYLHSHDIVHRDLKLENVLYESKAADSQLKVIDFGFAKVWDASKLMQASCGSIAYVSPDVLCGHGYTSKCDLWSLGVIVFMLLAGYPPFHGNDDEVRKSIVAADVDWKHPRRWAKVSPDAIDFVKALLVRDPVVRLDAQAALNHRWLTSALPTNRPVLSAASLRSIVSYAGAPSLRRAVLQLVARELSPDDVADLRRAFLDMAGDEEGTVRLSELKAAIRGDESVQPADFEPKTPARRLRRAKTDKLVELFQAMDVNGDEQIYYSDFVAATMKEKENFRQEHLWAAFRRLDADSSGAISTEDILSTMGETFEGVETRQLIRDAGLSPSAHENEISFDMFLQLLENSGGLQRPIKDDSYVVCL
jgi:calcium-dependent protein kinase